MHQALYHKIQRVATKLGYMSIKPGELERVSVLNNDDYLKVVGKIWENITSGIFIPENNKDNPWFCHLHLTEKGKKLLEK